MLSTEGRGTNRRNIGPFVTSQWCRAVKKHVIAIHADSDRTKICNSHGRPHTGANGVSWPPEENGWKINKRKHAKKSSFLCLCYILRAIRTGRCREWCYADHIGLFIQIFFRMHHFVVKFQKKIRLRQQGGIDPLTKILRTFLANLQKDGASCANIIVRKNSFERSVVWRQ